MDLSKHTLEECLIFIEKQGYTIKQCNYGNENTYTLLYICDKKNLLYYIIKYLYNI